MRDEIFILGFVLAVIFAGATYSCSENKLEQAKEERRLFHAVKNSCEKVCEKEFFQKHSVASFKFKDGVYHCVCAEEK